MWSADKVVPVAAFRARGLACVHSRWVGGDYRRRGCALRRPVQRHGERKAQVLRRSGYAAAALALVVVTATAISLSASPINTDVALTPREGGSILRLQFVYRARCLSAESVWVDALCAPALFASFISSLTVKWWRPSISTRRHSRPASRC